MAKQPEFYSGKLLYPAIAALLALSVLFGLVVMPRLAPAAGKMVDEPAPDFSLPVAANGDAGARMKLSELKGKIVVIDFWASWCGPCSVQAPILDRVARKYPNDVVVLGINVGESPARARKYSTKKGLSYPILSDQTGEAQRLYDANSLPTVIVVKRDGNIHTVVNGVVQQSALERVIKANL
jgi:thiol-disulfide isomerase/thioredoxin